jgi:hypothetical protein
VREDGACYFNAHGVQSLRTPNRLPDLPAVHRALRESWVLINTDLEWTPSSQYAISPFVIWTSSPHDLRWRYFCKPFWPCQRWFMKPWSTKEIAAAACVFSRSSGGTDADLGKHSDRFDSAHGDVLAKMAWCGPVPRHLFLGKPPTDQAVSNIVAALLGNPFADNVFQVTPAVVKDNGGRHLVWEDFSTEFLTPALAAKTVELAGNWMPDQLERFLS